MIALRGMADQWFSNVYKMYKNYSTLDRPFIQMQIFFLTKRKIENWPSLHFYWMIFWLIKDL